MTANPETPDFRSAPLPLGSARSPDPFTERVTAPNLRAPAAIAAQMDRMHRPPTATRAEQPAAPPAGGLGFPAHVPPQPEHGPTVAPTSATDGRPARFEADTHVADSVVAHIAAAAARDIPGVHALVPERPSDPVLRLLRRLNGSRRVETPGVRVQVGRDDVLIRLSLAVQFGVSIPQVVDAVRANVTSRVQILTGLRVRGVKIEVVDLHFPESVTLPQPAE